MKNSEQFKQLTFKQRKVIEKQLRRGQLQKDIAKLIGVNKSTISREIARRSRDGIYWADLAEANYQKRHQQCHPKRKINNDRIISYLCNKIKNGWSPEEISGRLKLEINLGQKTKSDYIGYETIYKIIYDSEFGKTNHLNQYLRRGKKHRTKKYGRKSQKSIIPNRISIDVRPEIVNQRQRLGDWESDSIIYPCQKAINSLVDRKILLTLLTKLERKTAIETMLAIISRLRFLPVETITFDNGSENTLHQEIAQSLGAETYFCHPYHSWEKGTNENTNGLVRRYLPRGKNIEQLTQAELNDIAAELNNRPRKKLGYYTPLEMLKSECYKLAGCNQI